MLEQEFKLVAATPEILHAAFESRVLRRHLGDDSTPPRRYLAIYYDTPARSLQAARVSLRARLEGNVFRAAFKLPGEIVNGLSTREEFETVIDGWIESPDSIPDGEFRERLNGYLGAGDELVPTVRTDIMRRIMMLARDGAEIEVVADEGVISAADRRVSLCELELELRSGDVAVLYELAGELQARYELSPATRTKHEIGLELMNESA